MLIGYEATIDLAPLKELIAAGAQNPSDGHFTASGGLLKAAVAQARALCDTALKQDKVALEKKALLKEHPWYGKKLKFDATPIFRGGLDGQGRPIIKATWSFEIVKNGD